MWAVWQQSPVGGKAQQLSIALCSLSSSLHWLSEPNSSFSSHTHTLSLSLSVCVCVCVSLSRSLSLVLILTQTRTHTLSLPPSLLLSRPCHPRRQQHLRGQPSQPVQQWSMQSRQETECWTRETGRNKRRKSQGRRRRRRRQKRTHNHHRNRRHRHRRWSKLGANVVNMANPSLSLSLSLVLILPRRTLSFSPFSPARNCLSALLFCISFGA